MAEPRPKRRARLSRERVLAHAMAYADEGGIEALTMRNLAEVLGVAPMALYRHVANKDDLVDGLVDHVFGEIELPPGGADWKSALRRRALSALDALVRHPWAIGLLESRPKPGPATLRHHDAMLGSLLAAGFSVHMAAHAYSLLDSYIHGFALGQTSLPFTPEQAAEAAHNMLTPFPAGDFPNLAMFITEHLMQPGYDYADEFQYGLDLILDGLERALKDGWVGRSSVDAPRAVSS